MLSVEDEHDLVNVGRRARPCGRSPSAEPLPGRLARDAESGADVGPAHLALAQCVDHLLQLAALALDGLLDGREPLEQSLGRHFGVRQLPRGWWAVGDDLVTELHALVADEDAAGTADQLADLMLGLGAEGAIEGLGVDHDRLPLRVRNILTVRQILTK